MNEKMNNQIVIPAEHAAAIYRPAFVFAWHRGQECMFVGTAGKNGIPRALMLGMNNEPGDIITVWGCERTEMALLEMEKKQVLQPRYNTFSSDAQGTCLNCGNPFKKNRKWQEYCGQTCQSNAQNKRKKFLLESTKVDNITRTQRDIMDMIGDAEVVIPKKKDKNAPVKVNCPECQAEHEVTPEQLKDVNSRFCEAHKHLRFQ